MVDEWLLDKLSVVFEFDVNTLHKLYTVLSRKYAPPRDNPPPPNSFDENYCAGTIISEDSDCDYNLCDVYKILYYAAVYVRGHFC